MPPWWLGSDPAALFATYVDYFRAGAVLEHCGDGVLGAGLADVAFGREDSFGIVAEVGDELARLVFADFKTMHLTTARGIAFELMR